MSDDPVEHLRAAAFLDELAASTNARAVATPPAVRSLEVAPMPLRTSAVVQDDLVDRAAAAIEVFDASGRLRRTLPVEPRATAGSITWDRRNSRGMPVASGIYVVALFSDAGLELSRKIVVR